MRLSRSGAALGIAGLLLSLGAGCAGQGAGREGNNMGQQPGPDASQQSTGQQSTGQPSTGAEGGGMTPDPAPACGDRVDALVSRPGSLEIKGAFPGRVASGGDGTFAVTVTATGTAGRVTGTTSPYADIYVARAGEIVATPLPKDLIGRRLDLAAGASQTFTARGSLRQCTPDSTGTPASTPADGTGAPLAPGRYEVYAVVSVIGDDGKQVTSSGGPWMLEVT